MAYILKDRCLSVTSTTGTGTLTLGSAVAGHQGVGEIGDGNSGTFTVYEVDGSGVPDGNWEVFVGTYTASGTTLSRQYVLASSNSGSAVDFGAGDKYVALVSDASVALPPLSICEGRLTLLTGNAITGADQDAKATLYYTPYCGNRIALYNGYSWQILNFAELSLDVSALTADKVYDIWAYISSGAVALDSTVWTNDTTRATALSLQDGVYIKAGDATRRYLGSIRTYSSSGTKTKSTAKDRWVWNVQNQLPHYFHHNDTTSSWTYNSGTVRALNNNSANNVSAVVGVAGHAVGLTMSVLVSLGSGAAPAASISTSTSSDDGFQAQFYATATLSLSRTFAATVGLNTWYMVEASDGGTTTFYGGKYNALKGSILC